MVKSASFEDCGITIIKEGSCERTVSKCRRSVVWQYFNKLVGDDEGSKCTLCGNVLRDCGNTTNLFKVTKL